MGDTPEFDKAQQQLDRMQEQADKITRTIQNNAYRLREMLDKNQIMQQYVAVDNRRMALDKAQEFFSNSITRGVGIVNAAAILGVAKMCVDFLDNGTVPDLVEEARETGKYTRTILEGMFPASIIEELEKEAQK